MTAVTITKQEKTNSITLATVKYHSVAGCCHLINSTEEYVFLGHLTFYYIFIPLISI